ncbi:MAG: FHA domain-containing protein [Phycisphaerae bacterium]|jgi:pSer/pThr/pTyr-binding forkhead associated (FHA) protein|nr:FHA domain-containing protein [Phycisphaerae bacterium]
MDVKLILVKGNPKGKQITLKSGTTIVGRKEDSGLIIASSRVSRHHCQITLDGNDLKVRDLGSANGTLINGQKVEESPLKAGDEVHIGPLGFLVEIDGRRTPDAAPSNPGAKPLTLDPPPDGNAGPRRGRPLGGRSSNDILAGLEDLAPDDD